MRHTDSAPGWHNRKFRDLQRQLDQLAAAKRIPGTSFPPGSIPTSAIATQAAPGFVYLTATNFALTTTGATILTGTVTVPPLMTSCVVSLTGRVYAGNSTASTDFLYARVEIDTSTGTALPAETPAGAGRTNVATLAAVLTGLAPGGTFPVRVWARSTTAAWSAAAANTVDLAGSLGWFS